MNTYDEGLRFLRRMYAPRAIGLALGGVCIGAVLWENGDATPALWTALALSALAWPHMAYWFGRDSGDPYRTELSNLTVDSALGGAWIALMKFNLLPSVLLLAMLSMDKLAVGGPRFLARCTAALAAACAASALLFGFEVKLESSLAQILGSLPLLVIYPLTVGAVSYRLARRVRQQNRLLSEMSRTDSLSGLLNRRSWEDAVSAEFQRCRRGGRPATLLMLDIDHFKSINDRHGHPAGDAVIRSVAAVLRDTLREQDLGGRYGGEEFGIVLPETAAAGARAIAERVRRRIAASGLPGGVGCTASIGIAELRPRDSDYAEWISRADRALYAAKERGRNRCETLEAATASPGAR